MTTAMMNMIAMVGWAAQDDRLVDCGAAARRAGEAWQRLRHTAPFHKDDLLLQQPDIADDGSVVGVVNAIFKLVREYSVVQNIPLPSFAQK